MLKIPAWRTFPEHRVTAYQDDTQFWKFYLIAEYVTIRKDANGKPVFLLIAYAFGDQDREENKNLPRGGGYMVMDTELRVEPVAMGPITAQLQKDVDDLWHQMKALADSAGQDVRGYRLTSHHKLPGVESTVSLGVKDVLLGLGPDAPEAPPGNAPPKVIFADPTWVEGTFQVSAPQSTTLVTNRLAEGPLSLIGGNVAAVNIELTSAGADFMVQTLVDPEGTGATDLTPVQIRYIMKFWARVPPVKIHAEADTRSVYESTKGIFHNYSDGGCDEDTISHSEQYMEMAISSGIVKVRVDKADPDTPDDIVSQMRMDAVSTITKQLADRFMDRKPAPPAPADDATKDFVKRESDVYYLKSENKVDFSHFAYDEELSNVRKWPINPQGTLQAFLKGLSPQEVGQYVRKINLDDPFFQTLNLKVAVFGVDWANDPVDFVEVELHYEGTDENGRPDVKSTTAVLTKDVHEFSWDPSLIGAKREYQYRWRIGYRGHEPSAWSAWESATTNRLTLGVRAPGKLEVKFLAGNIDFASITKSVQIELEYEDRTQGVEKDGTTLMLNAAAGEQSYKRWIFVPQTKPLRYRSRFFLKNDQLVETPWAETNSDQLPINEPRSDNRLDVMLVPTGNWSQVVQTVVSLRYNDPRNAISVEGLYQLKSADEFKTWAAYLAEGAPRKFEYKVISSFKDGSSDETSWVQAEGDQPLSIKVKEPPELQVEVIPVLLDFTVTPVVEVHLRYDDDANDIHESETFAFTSAEKKIWNVLLKNPAKKDFKVKVTYNTADGKTIELPEVESFDTKVTVNKLLVPEVSCLMVPKLVDFIQTPVVEVNLHYADPAHGIDATDTFTFTEPKDQQFRVQVAQNSPRQYEVEVTYYLADGKIVKRPPVGLAQSKIVVPKFVAAV